MTSFLVYSDGYDVIFERLLSAFGPARFRTVSDFAAVHAALQPSDLVIRIYSKEYGDQDEVFFHWLHATRAPSLQVELATSEVSIGPLALPGRSCCGYCARARRLAASAELNTDERSSFRPDFSGLDRILAAELRTLADSELSQSHLLDHVIIHHLHDGKAERSTRHRVVPLPWCVFCGGSSGRRDQVAPITITADDPPEQLLRALDGWVDAYTGVISRLEIEKPTGGREVPVIATAAPPHILMQGGSLQRLPLGWGKGLTLSAALLSAIGEAIERYSASLPDPLRLVWARCEEL